MHVVVLSHIYYYCIVQETVSITNQPLDMFSMHNIKIADVKVKDHRPLCRISCHPLLFRLDDVV